MYCRKGETLSPPTIRKPVPHPATKFATTNMPRISTTDEVLHAAYQDCPKSKLSAIDLLKMSKTVPLDIADQDITCKDCLKTLRMFLEIDYFKDLTYGFVDFVKENQEGVVEKLRQEEDENRPRGLQLPRLGITRKNGSYFVYEKK